MDFLHSFGTNTLSFIVVVGVLVFVHEFGHYWVALKNGVKVETFSIGFGPELFSWKDKHQTKWRVAAIPLGGYVKMFGDADPSSMPTNGEAHAAMTAEDRAGAFFAKSIGQRAAIVAAGPLINFLFTLVVLFGLFVTVGQPRTLPVVEELMEGMPAQAAGILPGDRIISLNGETIERFQEIQEKLAINLDHPVVLGVERAGQTLTINLTPVIEDVTNNFGGSHRVGRLGIKGQKLEYVPLSLGKAAVESVKETGGIITSTLSGIYQMVVGERSSREMGGMIAIAKMSGDMVSDSVTDTIAGMLWFMAVLSANLGLINLFPIPVLDGGHLVFLAFEKLRGKQLGDAVQEYSLRFGLALVLTLTVFAFWNDLRNFGVVDFVSRLFL